MSDSTISGRGKEPLLHAKHPAGKENKPKVGSLEARGPEKSKEATTSRAKKTQAKTGVLKERVNGSLRDRAVGVGEKGMPPSKLDQIEFEILSFGKVALDPHGEKPSAKKVKQTTTGLHFEARNIVSFINAGGLEVYKKIASHYDALASEAIDPKQKEVYQKISYTYSAKVTSINTRQVEINEKLENEKIMTHSPLQERSFAGKVDTALMKRIESMTKKMIDETDNRILMTEGCIIKPKEGFTDEFNKKLSTSYAAEPTAKERTVPYVLNGKSQIVCAVAYQDLNRSTYVLEGRKLSQCMCQEMGNGYVVTSGESENSPQRIAGKPFTVPDSAGDLERHFEIDKTENGSIVLRSIDRIKNINFIMRDGAMIDTNPEGTSLNLEVGIVLNANNEWEAYEGGSIEFEVSVVNTKANMKSLLS